MFIPYKEGFITNYYLHHDNRKVGVVTIKNLSIPDCFELANKSANELAHNLSMHIVALNPSYTCTDEINWDEVDLSIPENMSKKPEKIINLIISGKKNKYIQEHVFLSQPFVTTTHTAVVDYIEECANKVDPAAGFKMKEWHRIEV